MDYDEHQKLSQDSRKTLRSLLFAQSPSAARFGKRVHASSGDESGHAKRRVSGPEMDGNFDIKQLAGVTAPVGFFDPVGFTSDKSEGKVRFYREVELKHGRLGMLAALGFLVGEISIHSSVATSMTQHTSHFSKPHCKRSGLQW